ncbi:hypothetical protein ABT390_22975 [Streptomyces aurantiacus]|uniref:hypothetical protein n=1 Tax=Streptomyces aurantiacus TaxID=47760 RepID=UPI00331BAC47
MPVTRVTGTTKPVRVRRAAEFAHRLGEMAVQQSGGPAQVATLAAQAEAEGVPLWMARRYAPGPAGAITVAVDRRLVRVDVWGPMAPVVRVRAPHGLHSADRTTPNRGLVLTVGTETASLTLTKVWRKTRSFVTARTSQHQWDLQRESSTSSRLLRDGQQVALLIRPPRRRRPVPGTVLLPLSDIRHDSHDPLDAVMAHAFAVTFGLGDTTGAHRFRTQPTRRPTHEGEPVAVEIEWDSAWYSNLGWGGDDNESGGGDGWGSDGGDGGDGGGGGGDGGGGDGGGGGGGD